MGKTLVVCEKPVAAIKIASALADGKPRKKELNGVPYYEFERDGKRMVVVPALGHLFTLKNLRPMRDYPFYDIDWMPVYEVSKKAERARAFAETIKELAKGASDYISACDFDIEGSTIAVNVLRYLCGEDSLKRAKRMKFSTLTTAELRQAYERLMPSLDFELIEAGTTRHTLDWYWGQNTSKAMSDSVKVAHGRFAKLSAGRVQSPLLKILVEREREIRAFEPEPFWVLSLLLELGGKEVIAECAVPRFFEKAEAERALHACENKPARVTMVQAKQYERTPPVPFDLGSLQSEAYRCFGYTPMRTQQIAQALYQAALISYPRTSSQKLPPTIGYEQIIKLLGEIPKYEKLAKKLLKLPQLKPHEGPREDPAHPSIFCTGEKPRELTGPQQKLYDLIVRRFLATFASPARVKSARVGLDVGGQSFLLRGRRVLEKGWLEHYSYAETEEIVLPELHEGQILGVKRVLFQEKETQPKPRYNPASIVKKMDEVGIGTKATRGPILQNIYERSYIFGNQIEVSGLGMKVVETLSEHCPDILSEELTSRFEREMEAIQMERRCKEEIIEKARKELDKILEKFRAHRLEIGKQLGEAYRIARQKQRTIGTCAKCGGNLKIVISRTTHKRFAGCSNYPKCKNSFPLPQIGMIISIGKTCERCGAPMIQVNRIGRRPYRMCVDPKCPDKADWGKMRSAGKVEEAREK